MGKLPNEQRGRAGKGKDIVSPRGCLTTLGIAWLIWIFLDLFRLDVMSGNTPFTEAARHMPSIGIPLAVLVCMAVVVASGWRLGRRKKSFPGEPWMWDRDWDRTGARAELPDRVVKTLILALALTQATMILCFVIYFFPEYRIPYWVLTPFAAIAIGIWVLFTRETVPILRFGRPFFRYRAFPFFIGTKLEGTLEGLDRMAGFDEIIATLRCVTERSYTWRGNLETRKEILSEQVQRLAVSEVVMGLVADKSGTKRGKVLPVSFDLPRGSQGTRLLGTPVRKWELEMNIEGHGASYNATFPLPVYTRPVD